MENIMNDDDEIMEKARKTAILARKAIAEAERALQRTQDYFRSTGIDTESLISKLEKEAGPNAKREIESMVEVAIQDVKREADDAIREARNAELAPPARRKIRQLI
jgi:hypothetical protein